MCKEILLIRHGETDWNVQRRFQGSTDIPLNENGERQAVRVRPRICAWRPQAVWVSPLGRARRTAELVASDFGGRTSVQDDLREICFGDWEGRRIMDLKDHEDSYRRWLEDPTSVSAPNGESPEEVSARARRTLKKITESDSDRILIISHGGTIRAILSEALMIPMRAAWTRFMLCNCSLTGMAYARGKFVLHFYNDQLHCCENSAGMQNFVPVQF